MTCTPSPYLYKAILAPMVRTGVLPFRLLCLRYGADLVYSEELIDYKLIKCTRRTVIRFKLICKTCSHVICMCPGQHPLLDRKHITEITKVSVNLEKFSFVPFTVVEYLDDGGQIIFSTCEEESRKNILQIGTKDPTRASKIYEMLAADIWALDVNMGCPKPFSVSGGMGSALLKSPPLISSIMQKLVQTKQDLKAFSEKAGTSLNTPNVTCKIRLISQDVNDTLTLINTIMNTKVDALAIHGRFVSDRPSVPMRYALLSDVASAYYKDSPDTVSTNTPLIANGVSLDIRVQQDYKRALALTKCPSMMLARAAMHTPSIFYDLKGNTDFVATDITHIQDFLKYAITLGNAYESTKFVVSMLCGHGDQSLSPKITSQCMATKTDLELYKLFGMDEYYYAHHEHTKQHLSETEKLKLALLPCDVSISVKYKTGLCSLSLEYTPQAWSSIYMHKSGITPATIVAKHLGITQSELDDMVLVEKNEVGHFKAIFTQSPQYYTHQKWLRNKRFATQTACLSYLIQKGIIENKLY